MVAPLPAGNVTRERETCLGLIDEVRQGSEDHSAPEAVPGWCNPPHVHGAEIDVALPDPSTEVEVHHGLPHVHALGADRYQVEVLGPWWLNTGGLRRSGIRVARGDNHASAGARWTHHFH